MQKTPDLATERTEILKQLSEIVDFSLNNPLEIWGPIHKIQYDSDGRTPLQRYATLAVKLRSLEWILVCRIENLSQKEPVVGVPFYTKISEREACDLFGKPCRRR